MTTSPLCRYSHLLYDHLVHVLTWMKAKNSCVDNFHTAQRNAPFGGDDERTRRFFAVAVGDKCSSLLERFRVRLAMLSLTSTVSQQLQRVSDYSKSAITASQRLQVSQQLQRVSDYR